MASRIRTVSCLAIGATMLVSASTAWAAEITDVIDAADVDLLEGKLVEDYFDFHVEPTFKQTFEQAKITREANCVGPSGRCQEDAIIINKEMRYERTINELDLEFELSVYKDLEIHVQLPIVFSDVRGVKYARNAGSACEFDINPDNPKCVDATNSTLDPSDQRIEADRTDGGDFSTYRYFDLEEDEFINGPERSGLGDMTFGIDWAPFNDQRYPSDEDVWLRNHGRATLVFGFDYTAPTADAAKVDNDAVGRGRHELQLRVATSRRFKYADPYMQFKFGLPLAVKDSAEGSLLDYGGGQERVNPGPWGNITVGIEFVPWERLTAEFQQRFAIDIRGVFGYVGEGRDYGPFFDAIGQSQCQGMTLGQVQPGGANPECGWIAEKWANAGFNNLGSIDPFGNPDPNLQLFDDGMTSYEGYGVFGALLGFYVQPVQYVQLRAQLGLTHNTEHFVTFGKAGEDVRGREAIDGADPTRGTRPTTNPNVPADGTVSFDDIKERNPVYNPTYDAVGSRFRLEEDTVFTWNLGLAFQF